MKLYNLIKFAWKNLWAHRMRTFLTVSGVTIGIGAIIFLVSIGFGLEQLVTNQVANFEAFTVVDVPAANIRTGKINQEIIDRVTKIGHVTKINELVDLAGRIRLANQDSATEAVIVGTDPLYFDLSAIAVSEGKLYEENNKPELVINSALANLLGYENNYQDIIDQDVLLDAIIAEELRNDDTDGPITKEGVKFKVIGVMQNGQNPILYIPLNQSKKLGVVNFSSLKLKIDNREYVEEVRKSIENIGFSTEYIGDTVEEIGQIFSLFRVVLGGFGLIALLVAALATFNTLTISLFERIREVGLLKTLGMKKRDIFKLFISESLTIGIIGGILGLALGQLIGWGINSFLLSLAERSGSDPVTVYMLPTNFAIFVGIGSIVVGFVTGFYPAYKAIKTDALDALRYE